MMRKLLYFVPSLVSTLLAFCGCTGGVATSDSEGESSVMMSSMSQSIGISSPESNVDEESPNISGRLIIRVVTGHELEPNR